MATKIYSRSMLKGSTALLVASIVARGSMLLFRYISALSLSPDDYGRLSLYISLFLSMSTIASFGMGGSLAKLAVKESETGRNPRALFGSCILLTVFTTLLATFVFVLMLRQSAHELLTYQIVTVSVVGFLFWSYYQISVGFSIAELKFGLASLYEAGGGIVKFVLLVVAGLFVSRINLELCIFSFSLAYVLLFAFAAWNNTRIFGIGVYIFSLKFFNWPLFRKIVSHSSALMMITFINLFYGFLLRSFLSAHSNVDVAVFDMAFTFYSVPRMVFASLVRPVVPYATRQRDGKIAMPAGVGRIIILIALSLSCAYILEIKGLVSLVLRFVGLANYVKSFPIFLILMFGAFFDLAFGFFSSYFQGLGKVNLICLITVCVFIIALPFSFYAVKIFKVYGAAISYVAFLALLAGLSALLAYKHIGFRKV